jgi:plasmid maintenance system killer protein
MVVEFDTKKLAKELSDPKVIKRKYGDLAKGIIARLADLEAAETLADLRTLPAAQCHELSGDRAGYFAVKISPNYRLIFLPSQQPPPKLEDGGIDWTAIDAVVITEITDYH